MATGSEMTELEKEAYSASFSDGLFDLFFGLSVLWIGAAWIWLEDYAGLAGILPAIFIAPMIEIRKRILEPRVGYVKWTEVRRTWERRRLIGLFALGTLMFAAGVIAHFVAGGDGGFTDVMRAIVPALPAWLLALPALFIWPAIGVRRVLGYAALFAAGGAGVILTGANPGWGLFPVGAIITVVAGVMIWRFFKNNPVVEAS